MKKNFYLQRLKNKRTVIIIILLAVFIITAVVCDTLSNRKEPVKQTFFAMGAPLDITLYGGIDGDTNDIVNGITELENSISKNIAASFTSEINKNGSAKVNSDYINYIDALIDISKATDGKFDIATGALTELWEIDRGNTEIPDSELIRQALNSVGFEKIKTENGTVSVPSGTVLDFGSAGKGMACDTAKEIIKNKSNIKAAVLASGGSIMLYGNNPNRDSWKVGIKHPRGNSSDVFAVLELQECFISTSGDYEKFFFKDGKRYCHIFDPETGYPVNSGYCSVTVIADSGMISDALSTACLILGREKSIPLLEKYNAKALFITTELQVETVGDIIYSTES